MLILLGALGYAALFVLYPRLSPARRWGYTLDRTQAISLTRAEVAGYGYDLSGWRVRVTPGYDRQLNYYLTHQPNAVVASLLSTVTTNGIYDAPDSKQQLTATLNARGQLIKIDYLDNRTPAKANAKAETKPALSASELQQAKVAAETALKQLVGESYQQFNPVADFTSNEGEPKFNWVAAFPDDARLTLTAEATAKAGHVIALNLTPKYSPAFQAELARQEQVGLKWLSLAASLATTPVYLLGLIFYFIALARKEIQHRQALTYFGAVLLFLALTEGLSGSLDLAADNGIFKVSGTVSVFVRLLAHSLSFAVFILFPGLLLYAFWASGQALAAKLKNRRTLGLELLLQGNLRNQYVTGNLLVGLLLGGLIAALPYLVQASGLFNNAEVNIGSLLELLTARAPAPSTLSTDRVLSPVLFFSFVVPLLEFYLRRSWLTRLAIFALGFLWFYSDNHFALSEAANGVNAVLLVALLYWIYQRFDLLGLLSANLASQTALGALTLLVQPSPSLHVSAFITLGALGTVLLVAFVLYRSSVEVDTRLFEPLYAAEGRAERERLKAELEVASRAQRQMLPNAPPEVPGFELAAICQPSKDVGGDLYDFIPLPQGKLAITVADVSGKGVPAALYMTLTKGVLEAVAQEKTDPGEILREVNRHLYEACRRKVFVTLFLGVLDPLTRTFTYARAGHNPPVWRSPLSNDTRWLRPAGIGLGLNQGKMFNATLKVETLQLAPQDALFLYSDGITEAMNKHREEYGEERLLALAEKTDGLGADAARDLIMTDVKAFLGTVPPQDDQTLVVLKVA